MSGAARAPGKRRGTPGRAARLRTILPAALAALLALMTGTAELPAYTFSHTDNGVVQKWNVFGPIRYYLNTSRYSKISNADLDKIVKDSFQAWQDNPLCTLTFTYGTTATNRIGNDNQNIVIFDSKSYDSQGQPFVLTSVSGSSTIGLTYRTFRTNGEILDADIIFNEDYTFTTGTTNLGTKTINLQDVLTHEIGHLLGLNHTYLEHATMWPYAAPGQAILEDDDKAGAGALYPSSQWTGTDSIWGTVRNAAGQPVWGVHVSAIRDGETIEAVGAVSGPTGRYSIRGLAKGQSWRLRARSVDLSHLDNYYINGGTDKVFIPKYYPNATRRDDATPVAVGQGGVDFEMSVATVLARYDANASFTSVYLLYPPGNPATESYYLGVLFPSSSLPTAFTVFGMQFWNNDENMFWPRIMLCEDSNGKPNLQNVIRDVRNYKGKAWDYSFVEWEAVTITNLKDIWVVFQLPNKTFVGQNNGAAIGGVSLQNYYGGAYYSLNGGSSFQKFAFTQNIDPIVSLTVAETSAPVPMAQVSTQPIDFGTVRMGTTAVYPLPVSNPGTGDLVVSNISSERSYIRGDMTDYRVPPGRTDTIRVRFTPVATSSHQGTLTILSNASPARIDISVLGRGGYPFAALTATALDFGAVDVGQSAGRGLYLKSTGAAPLKAWGFAAQPPFSTPHADTLTVAAGDSTLLTVNFAPLHPGAFSGTFTFSLDDSARTVASVGLSGSGIGEVKSCDFTGDGKVGLVDVVAFILLGRADPSDPRLDWNEDGAFTPADAVALANDIRAGNCPGSLLAGIGGPDEKTFLAALKREEIEYLRQTLDRLDLRSEVRRELDLLLAAAGPSPQLPRSFELAQNYPNPFNPRTAITYRVPEDAGDTRLSLVVYDIRGQLIRTLVDGVRGPGEHTVYWQGEDESGQTVPSGIYFYRLRAEGLALTRKMVLLK